MNNIPVVLEIGTKRSAASALEWPGWSRSGKTEAAAITALLKYAPRYARAMNAAGIPFQAPLELAAFEIIERLPGNATTDFGGLGAVPAYDLQPLEAIEYDRQLAILGACWFELDAASAAASGKNLRLDRAAGSSARRDAAPPGGYAASLFQPARMEGTGNQLCFASRKDRLAAGRYPPGAERQRTRRAAFDRTARRKALVSAQLRAPQRLAYLRSQLGN